MLPRTGSIAKAAACADAARAIFDAAPEHQLLDVLQSAPVIDLRAQFLRHLRSVPAKGVRFYPDGLVALTYRYQQVSMNAHPADFGASCPRTARFVLEYRDRDLRFAPLDGACTTRLSFGSVRRLQRRVVDEPEADTCTQQDRSYVHAKTRQCASRLVQLRQLEQELSKKPSAAGSRALLDSRRAYAEAQAQLVCSRADPDPRVRNAMRRLFALGTLAVNMQLLREHLGPWVSEVHVWPESPRPTVLRVMPGWYCLRECVAGNRAALRRLKLYLLTLYPREHTMAKLRTFVPERVGPSADPRLQNLRLADYIDATLASALADARVTRGPSPPPSPMRTGRRRTARPQSARA